MRSLAAVLLALAACSGADIPLGGSDAPDATAPPLDAVVIDTVIDTVEVDAPADAPVDAPADAPVDAVLDAVVPPVELTVVKTGTGGGFVTSAPTGISCGATCSFVFPFALVVTLAAAPLAGSHFDGWSSAACPSASSTCSVVMDGPITITAIFNSP